MTILLVKKYRVGGPSIYKQKQHFFSESCWGKAVVAYTNPHQCQKEESNRLRGEGDEIKFIDLR